MHETVQNFMVRPYVSHLLSDHSSSKTLDMMVTFYDDERNIILW